jgi:hypothetical protein
LTIPGSTLAFGFESMSELEIFSKWGSSTKTPTI